MSVSPEEYDLRLIDAFRKSLFIYWSSLLTINGLLFSFFSADVISPSADAGILIYILIGFSVLSIWLLIWNFRVIKVNYYDLGRIEENWPDLPQEEIRKVQSEVELSELIDRHSKSYREENLEKAGGGQKWMMRRERAVEVLLILETVLVFLALIFQV